MFETFSAKQLKKRIKKETFCFLLGVLLLFLLYKLLVLFLAMSDKPPHNPPHKSFPCHEIREYLKKSISPKNFKEKSCGLVLLKLFGSLNQPYDPFPCQANWRFWNIVGEDLPLQSTLDETILFVITPTYTRSTQYSDLLRVGQSLMLAKNKRNIVWIVVEDSPVKTKLVTFLLSRISVAHVHLLGPKPDKLRSMENSGKGVWTRNNALCWLRHHYTPTKQRGVVYFADDDNAYDHRLWEELEVNTRKVSVLPVGLVGRYGMSTPIVNMRTGKIVGFHDGLIAGRKFPMNTAGFSVDLQFLLGQLNASWPPFDYGYEEEGFLRSLNIEVDDLVPIANNCTEVSLEERKRN